MTSTTARHTLGQRAGRRTACRPARCRVPAGIAAALAAWLVLLHPLTAWAAPGLAELQQADAALGRQLIAQHRCSECHIRKVGGDGSAIYRPQGRISRPAALLAMVEMCNTELNLQLFPDDVAAIAAALNQAHYRFKAGSAP
jgi:hypothetical protein